MVRAIKDDEYAVASGVPFLFEVVIEVMRRLFKELRKYTTAIHFWHGKGPKYSYHIQEEIRPELYDYLPEKEGHTRRIGFVFGNDIYSAETGTFEIGIYGFLPLEKLIEQRGEEKIGKTAIKDLADFFAEKADKRKLGKTEIDTGKKLLEFILTKCCDKNFPQLLISPEKSPFASLYKELYSKRKGRRKRMVDFLRASFRGMYVSSEEFRRIGLGTRFSDLVESAQRRQVSEAVIKKKAQQYCDELGVKAIKIMKPVASKEEVRKEIVVPSMILLRKTDYKALRNLIKVFKEELKNFEVEKGVSRPLKPAQRVPIIVDAYRVKGGRLASICTGYNERKEELQQIRLWKRRVGEPVERFEYLLSKYAISK